jgi:hypothetical protein
MEEALLKFCNGSILREFDTLFTTICSSPLRWMLDVERWTLGVFFFTPELSLSLAERAAQLAVDMRDLLSRLPAQSLRRLQGWDSGSLR